MKYLSFVAFAMFAVAMTLSFSACGDDDDDGKGSSKQPTEKPLTPEGKKVVAVDLGLPSGTLWADRNVGAENPEDYGSYFAWGETEPKDKYTWSTYKWGKSEKELVRYCNKAEYGKEGYTDSETELLPEDDAASYKLGGKWIMPTLADVNELVNNTDHKWESNYNGTGVSGFKFTNKNDASKYIFLPAAGSRKDMSVNGDGLDGYYWSRTLSTGNPRHAQCLYFYTSYVSWSNFNRYFGHTVRPIIAP